MVTNPHSHNYILLLTIDLYIIILLYYIVQYYWNSVSFKSATLNIVCCAGKFWNTNRNIKRCASATDINYVIQAGLTFRDERHFLETYVRPSYSVYRQYTAVVWQYTNLFVSIRISFKIEVITNHNDIKFYIFFTTE